MASSAAKLPRERDRQCALEELTLREFGTVTRHKIVRGKPGRVPGGWSENSSAGPGISRQKLEIGGAHDFAAVCFESWLRLQSRGSSQRLPTSWRCARTGAVVDVYP